MTQTTYGRASRDDHRRDHAGVEHDGAGQQRAAVCRRARHGARDETEPEQHGEERDGQCRCSGIDADQHGGNGVGEVPERERREAGHERRLVVIEECDVTDQPEQRPR